MPERKGPGTLIPNGRPRTNGPPTSSGKGGVEEEDIMANHHPGPILNRFVKGRKRGRGEGKRKKGRRKCPGSGSVKLVVTLTR